MKQVPMISKMVELQLVVVVLEEEVDSQRYQDRLSVEDVAKRN